MFKFGIFKIKILSLHQIINNHGRKQFIYRRGNQRN